MTWLLFALVPSLAGTPDQGLLTGADLLAWRTVLETPSPSAFLDFIASHPESPLAELALRRWQESPETVREESLAPPARIALSLRHHEAALRRKVLYQGVVRLEPELQP